MVVERERWSEARFMFDQNFPPRSGYPNIQVEVHVYIFTRREDRLRHHSFISVSNSLCMVRKDRDYGILHQDKQGHSWPLETILLCEECERQLVRILTVRPPAVKCKCSLLNEFEQGQHGTEILMGNAVTRV